MRKVRHGTSQPNQLDRDEVYLQHDPSGNKIFGFWAGTKNDERRCVVPHKLTYPGDGNNHTVKPEEKYVGPNTTSSVATITMPDPADINDGHELIIEDDGGNAGTNNITVATPGSETIDTASISTNGGKVHYMWDEANSNWKDVS